MMKRRGEAGTEAIFDKAIGNDEFVAAEHERAFCKWNVFNASGADRFGWKRRVAIAAPGHQGTEGLLRGRGGQGPERTSFGVDPVSRMADDDGTLAIGQPRRDDFFRAFRERDVVAPGHDDQLSVR